MAIDYFLLLDGIKGEAQDSKYPDEIDILSWSWGASQSGTTHAGLGSGSGKVSVQDFSLTKHMDKSSATLLQHCASGKHIKKGKFIARKAGDKPMEYFTLELEDIIITHVSMGGHGSEDRTTESVTLNFAQYHMKYAAQNADGSRGKEVEHKFHIAQNKHG